MWPIWQRLTDRSAALGCPLLQPNTITDPELRVVTSGQTLCPLHSGNGQYFVALPHSTNEVCRISHARVTHRHPPLARGPSPGWRSGRSYGPAQHKQGIWCILGSPKPFRRQIGGGTKRDSNAPVDQWRAVVPLPALPDRSPTMREVSLERDRLRLT